MARARWRLFSFKYCMIRRITLQREQLEVREATPQHFSPRFCLAAAAPIRPTAQWWRSSHQDRDCDCPLPPIISGTGLTHTPSPATSHAAASALPSRYRFTSPGTATLLATAYALGGLDFDRHLAAEPPLPTQAPSAAAAASK